MGEWLTAELTYEGFPLMLRRPAELDVDLLRPLFRTLLVVTHVFEKRRPNGLPDPDYNETIFPLDEALVGAFDDTGDGAIALVETFGGERNYYFYITDDIDVGSVIASVEAIDPTAQLNWNCRSDPSWKFLEHYASEYY